MRAIPISWGRHSPLKKASGTVCCTYRRPLVRRRALIQIQQQRTHSSDRPQLTRHDPCASMGRPSCVLLIRLYL